MIEIITKNGKKIGKLSDSLDQDDTLVIDGKEIKLSNVYADQDIKKLFNSKVQELTDDAGKTTISETVQDIIYQKFCNLPLKNKLVIYAKFIHGNSFKPQNNDLFGLNRRSISKMFRSFIDSLKEDSNVIKKTKAKGSKRKSESCVAT